MPRDRVRWFLCGAVVGLFCGALAGVVIHRGIDAHQASGGRLDPAPPSSGGGSDSPASASVRSDRDDAAERPSPQDRAQMLRLSQIRYSSEDDVAFALRLISERTDAGSVALVAFRQAVLHAPCEALELVAAGVSAQWASFDRRSRDGMLSVLFRHMDRDGALSALRRLVAASDPDKDGFGLLVASTDLVRMEDDAQFAEAMEIVRRGIPGRLLPQFERRFEMRVEVQRAKRGE